jgi:vitamin B12/bleomycin/antimicrobial peptide transport system ATP-binding/permease protein
MYSTTPSFCSRLVAVTRPFFASSARSRAVAALALLFALLFGINGLNVVNSYVGRDFMTSLEQRELYRFYVLAGVFAGVFAASTLVQVLASYVQQRLGLLWRDVLTRQLLDRYLTGRNYHRLKDREDVDNPDQRICEDANTFTSTTLTFVVLLLNAVLTVIAFVGVLWLITPWLVLAAVTYAAAGSLGTILLGRSLVDLNNRQQRTEADFRFALGRVRDHAAPLARGGGEAPEKTRLGRLLSALITNMRRIIDVNRNLGFFTTGYNYLPQIIPAAIVAPLYIAGRVDFGSIPQAAMAFSQALGAFSLIVSQFQPLSNYAAVVTRLGELWEATDPEASTPTTASTVAHETATAASGGKGA